MISAFYYMAFYTELRLRQASWFCCKESARLNKHAAFGGAAKISFPLKCAIKFSERPVETDSSPNSPGWKQQISARKLAHLRVHMHSYTRAHARIHTYIYIYIHTYICTYMHLFILYSHVCLYVNVYIYIYIYIYIYTHTYTHTHTHIYIYIYVCLYMHLHAHTCMYEYTHTHIYHIYVLLGKVCFTQVFESAQ
jgi:hypothetical protein